MKALLIIFLISVQVLLGAATGAADTIIYDYRSGTDTYYGGTASGPAFVNQDVIPGNSNYEWDLTKIVVTETATKIQVKIMGPWFYTQDFYNSGDLYVSSSGWHTIPTSVDPANTSPHFPTDTFAKSEGWNYVITNRIPLYKDKVFIGYGSGVYKLSFDAVAYSNYALKMTDPTYELALGRQNQAYYGGYGDYVENATVSFYKDTTHPLDETNESYELYEFDKFLSGDIGLHWTMYCGNDVIEGQATITPEPGTLLLLGLGLVGVGVCRRRQ